MGVEHHAPYMRKNSGRIAFGGVIAALSLVLMFLTGLFPFASMGIPGISGVLLIAIVLEFNKKTALIAYGAIAILSFIVVPNKEAALFFTLFLGYYPIVKSSIEHIKSRVLEWGAKLLLFNIMLAAIGFVALNIIGIEINQFSLSLELFIPVAFVVGNIVFVIYDIALSHLVVLYFEKIRPKLSRVIK